MDHWTQNILIFICCVCKQHPLVPYLSCVFRVSGVLLQFSTPPCKYFLGLAVAFHVTEQRNGKRCSYTSLTMLGLTSAMGSTVASICLFTVWIDILCSIWKVNTLTKCVLQSKWRSAERMKQMVFWLLCKCCPTFYLYKFVCLCSYKHIKIEQFTSTLSVLKALNL